MLDIARQVYPDIKAVYVDTGLEYPEVRNFVKSVNNVEWLHPVKWDKHKREYVRTNFKEVILEHGLIISDIERRDNLWMRKVRKY